MHAEEQRTPDRSPDARDGVLVLCLGNDLLRDDGVGWAVADALDLSLAGSGIANPQSPIPNPEPPIPNPESRIPNPESRFFVKRTALSGFYLLDELTGWDRAVIVDAVQTGAHPPGTVLSFPFEALRSEAGPSPHAAGLPTVVSLGRRSGVPLPGWIHIVAIEVADAQSFVEGLTPAVEAAVPGAVEAVRSLLAGLPPGVGAPA